MKRCLMCFTVKTAFGRHIGFTADNGIDPGLFGLLIEVNGTKEIAMVRHSNGGHPKAVCLIHQAVDPIGSIEEAILCVQV